MYHMATEEGASKQSAVFRLRIEKALLDRAQKAAKSEARTLGSLVRFLLIQHLNGRRK